MLTDAFDQHDPVQWDKGHPASIKEEQHLPMTQQEKVQLPDMPLAAPIYAGELNMPTSDIHKDSTSLIDNIKKEPESDLIDYKIDFIDIDEKPFKIDPDPSTAEFESTEASNTDTIELTSQTGQQESESQEPKAKRKKYNESYLEETVNQVRNRTITLYAASKITGIPRATLQYRLSSVYKNKGTRGPYTIFSPIEEREIVKWINCMILKGFPVTRSRLQQKVSDFLKANPRKTPFKDNKPGKQWIRCFSKRNPDLSIPQYQSVNATQQDVQNWFNNVRKYLEENQLSGILEDPSRILMANDAGFMLHPTQKGVVETLNSKDVSFIETANGHHNITVMFTFVADGSFVPPLVVLPIKRLKQDVQQLFPSGWMARKSENGRLNVRIFTQYVMKVLYPTLVERGTKFPVVYFVDGHNSETAFEAADMCKKYGIILIALYPIAIQIIQQSNLAAFKVLKTNWTNVVSTWRMEHKIKRMTYAIFGSLLDEAMVTSLNNCTIKNGFNICGLYPFDYNAINFEDNSNIFAANPETNNKLIDYSSNITDAKEKISYGYVGAMLVAMGLADVSTNRKIEVPENVLRNALAMLSPSQINLYQTVLAEDLSPEDKVLSYIYRKILVLAESPSNDAIQESSNNHSTSNTGETGKPIGLIPDEDTTSLDFDISMNIKTENDSAESTGGKEKDLENSHYCDKLIDNVADDTAKSKNCQQNETLSKTPEEENNGAVHFATEHICSFPRITIHLCPLSNKTKYHSFFLDSTGLYMAYLHACHKSSQVPVSGKVYNEIVQQQRNKDPPLPSRCDDCQHVERYDLGELSGTLFEQMN